MQSSLPFCLTSFRWSVNNVHWELCVLSANHLCSFADSSWWCAFQPPLSSGCSLTIERLQCNVWRRQWHPTPVLLPGKSHGWRSLVGCSPWGRKSRTERLHFHFSLSCVGEGNGSPPQCSCLENPRDGGAWRAAVYGVAQSRTQLKWLSSSSSAMFSSMRSFFFFFSWLVVLIQSYLTVEWRL